MSGDTDRRAQEQIERLGGEEVVDRIGDWLMRCLALEAATDIHDDQRRAGYEQILSEIRSDTELNDDARKFAIESVEPFLDPIPS